MLTKSRIPILLILLCGQSYGESSHFVPLPFGGVANTSRCDKKADDHSGGWTDQGSHDMAPLKPGVLTVSGVPFEILPETDGKSCIVLGGPQRPYLPTSAEIPAGGVRGKYLYLLHAAAWSPPQGETRRTGELFVDYEDGSTGHFDVMSGRDVGEWTRADSYPNAARVWTAYNANTQVSLFGSRFEIADRPVKAVRLKADSSAWMLVAATVGDEAVLEAIKPTLTLDKTYNAPAAEVIPVRTFASETPKNIILIIGDGMGAGALQLASLYQHRAENRLFLQGLPVSGHCLTKSASSQVTDSAAAATAIATGHKTNNGHLGVSPANARLTTFAELARDTGRAIGLITSDPLTGATPAGFFAHVESRGFSQEIAGFAAESRFDILIGNASDQAWFASRKDGGTREDSRDLLAEMTATDYALINTQEQFDFAPSGRRVLGFMSSGTLDSEQCLSDLTTSALERLSQNPAGFFLMVECTITDKGGHSNDPELTVRGTLQVDWAVKAAMDFARTREDTLVLVTADHETGGLSARIEEGQPGKLAINYSTTSHTGSPVPLFAWGPGSQDFSGTIDNTAIAWTIARLWSLDLPARLLEPRRLGILRDNLSE